MHRYGVEKSRLAKAWSNNFLIYFAMLIVHRETHQRASEHFLIFLGHMVNTEGSEIAPRHNNNKMAINQSA